MPDPITPNDFETVRWKLAEDMDTHDIEVLMANKDKLNDEEKAAFANIITEQTPLPDNPLDAAINEAVDAPDTVTPPAPEVVTPPVEVAPVVPLAQPATPVIAQSELDAYLEGKKKEWDEQGKTAAQQQEEKKVVQAIFDAGYKPNDWNDFAVTYAEKMTPIIEKRIMDRLDAQNQERVKQQDELKQTAQKIYEGFEAEFKTLADKKAIPAPDAPEYKAIHDSIIAIGDKYGRKNITEAFELWSMIPKDKGGGLDYTPPPAVDPAAKIAAQKAAAGRVGAGTGTAAPVKKGNDWSTIHGTSMDDLLERRLQQN